MKKMSIKVVSHCHANQRGLMIYVPTEMALDSQFFLRPKDKIKLEMKAKKLEITKVDDEGDPDE